VGHASGGREYVRERIVKEIITSINVAADFEDGIDGSKSRELGRRTWVAVKLVSCGIVDGTKILMVY
jgi:proline dehydrogenase